MTRLPLRELLKMSIFNVGNLVSFKGDKCEVCLLVKHHVDEGRWSLLVVESEFDHATQSSVFEMSDDGLRKCYRVRA